MARTFRQRRQMHPVSELNVTNLVDLAFTLLIIFMIATPLIQQHQQTIPVNLPVESKSKQPEPDRDTVFRTVTIDKQGNYSLDDTPLSMADLQSRLRGFAAEPKPPVIRIRADLTLQWQQVVTLMDALKKAGLSKITFDTKALD